jgi:hypothetical protein
MEERMRRKLRVLANKVMKLEALKTVKPIGERDKD